MNLRELTIPQLRKLAIHCKTLAVVKKREIRIDRQAEKFWRKGRRLCQLKTCGKQAVGPRIVYKGIRVCNPCYGILTGYTRYPRELIRVPHKTRRAPNGAKVVG